MSDVLYKGYVIKAAPYHLAESKKWTININIEHHTGDRINIKNFSASNTFETKEEAIKYCIDFGRRIIDGEIAGCIVDDL